MGHIFQQVVLSVIVKNALITTLGSFSYFKECMSNSVTNYSYVGDTKTSVSIKTRGPRGPWVAHLRKRSKVKVKPIIENPRGII